MFVAKQVLENKHKRVARKQEQSECELCKSNRDLTFHHLIPRKLHRRTSFRKRYSRECLNRGIFICRLCHKGLHRLYDEMTLAKHFSDKEKILSDPLLSKHIDWSSKQKIVRYANKPR